MLERTSLLEGGTSVSGTVQWASAADLRCGADLPGPISHLGPQQRHLSGLIGRLQACLGSGWHSFRSHGRMTDSEPIHPHEGRMPTLLAPPPSINNLTLPESVQHQSVVLLTSRHLLSVDFFPYHLGFSFHCRYSLPYPPSPTVQIAPLRRPSILSGNKLQTSAAISHIAPRPFSTLLMATTDTLPAPQGASCPLRRPVGRLQASVVGGLPSPTHRPLHQEPFARIG
jgi:hypothetical protein